MEGLGVPLYQFLQGQVACTSLIVKEFLLQVGRGLAPLGLIGHLSWGIFVPWNSYALPGTSGPAQACSSHGDRTDIREQLEACQALEP